jgi:cytidylate kinase
MSFKLTLAGDQGGGKSTVAKLLTERTGAEYYSAGYFMRKCAAEMGMDIADFNVYSETHPEIDEHIDNGLVDLNGVDKDMIIDSRMAWHFTKGTFKVYLSCDIETSALRIMHAKRQGECSSSLEEQIRCTKERRESEKKRYLEQYGVDIKDLTNYSLVVDTTEATPEQVAEKIISAFEKWQADKSYTRLFISPERLHFPEMELDGDMLSPFNSRVENGEEVDAITVCEKDGEFYLVDGFAAAMAYVFNFSTFIPARLVKAEPKGEYVRMRNSL